MYEVNLLIEAQKWTAKASICVFLLNLKDRKMVSTR